MNAAYTTEANKIAAGGAWISLLEIGTTGYGNLRYTNNNEDVVWPDPDGPVYEAMPFTVDDVQVSTSGEFPEYKIYIYEVDTAGGLRQRVAATRGLVESEIRLRIVHSDHLELPSAAVDETAEVLACEVTTQAIVLTVGIPSLLSRRFPRDRYTPSFCRHRFGGAMCRYRQPTGAGASLTSSLISFVPGAAYNRISMAGGGLLDGVFDLAPGIRTCPGNLTVNGGFADGEQGSVSGWAYGSHATGWELYDLRSKLTCGRRWSQTHVKYGAYSYYHGLNLGSDPEQGLQQDISVSVGTVYSVSCWVWTDSTTASDGIRMRVYAGGPWSVTAKATTIGAWERLTITTVSAFTSILTIKLLGIGWAYFDGVCVVEGAVAGDFTRRNLDANAGFTISGSAHNDGFYLADNYYPVDDSYVDAFVVEDETFTAESAGESVTIQLGYSGCDHTLKACRNRDNAQNFGGSPGIAGGVYG